jgi:hypothetical protein
VVHVETQNALMGYSLGTRPFGFRRNVDIQCHRGGSSLVKRNLEVGVGRLRTGTWHHHSCSKASEKADDACFSMTFSYFEKLFFYEGIF